MADVCAAAAAAFLGILVHTHVNVFVYNEDVQLLGVLDLPAETQMQCVLEDAQSPQQCAGLVMEPAAVFVRKADEAALVFAQPVLVYSVAFSFLVTVEH